MRLVLKKKSSKFNVDSKNVIKFTKFKKTKQKVFAFSDNCI